MTSLDNKLPEASKGADLEFSSLTACIDYLRSLGLSTKRDTERVLPRIYILNLLKTLNLLLYYK